MAEAKKDYEEVVYRLKAGEKIENVDESLLNSAFFYLSSGVTPKKEDAPFATLIRQEFNRRTTAKKTSSKSDESKEFKKGTEKENDNSEEKKRKESGEGGEEKEGKKEKEGKEGSGGKETEEPSINDEDVKNFSMEFHNYLLSVNFDEIVEGMVSDLLVSFAYQGFDPAFIYKKMQMIAEARGRDLLKDVVTLLTFFLSRGTKISGVKFTERTLEAGKKIIVEIVKVYKIMNTGSGAGAKSRGTITLGRVAATFPHLCAMIIFKSNDVRIVGEPGKLPRFLAFAGGASLIPKDAKFDKLYRHYLLWVKTQDEQLNGNRKGAKADFKRAASFALIARSTTTYFDETFRLRAMEKLGIKIEDIPDVKDPLKNLKKKKKKVKVEKTDEDESEEEESTEE